MDKGRVGEESKGKEMDGCPLTAAHYNVPLVELKISAMQRYRSRQLPRSMHADQEHSP
jgi:hypothetical protein